MSNKKILLLIKDLSNLNSNENYLNFLPLDKYLKSKLKIIDIQLNTPSSKELYQKFDFCLNLYNTLLREVSKSLNIIHKVNFTIKQWELIIGFWLKQYIQSCFEAHNYINFVKKKYSLKKIYITDFKDFNFIPDNTVQLQNSKNDLDWNLNFYSKVIKYFETKNIVEKKNFFKKKNKKNVKKNKDIKTILRKLLNSIFTSFRSENDAFIANTYLPFLEEKKLEISINYLPSFYTSPDINYKPVDQEMRNKIKFNMSTSISLKNFIKSNFYLFMPKAFLENFHELIHLAKSKHFPQNPKFIFTSNLYAYDEVFKVYAANKIKKRSLFIGQHGNNYFTTIESEYFYESKIADKFLSWGYENRKEKIYRTFNFITFKKKFKKIKKNNKIIITLKYPDYISNFVNRGYDNVILFLEQLNDSIRKNVVLRLSHDFYKESFGIKYFKYFKNYEVVIDDGKEKFENLAKNAKLCVFFYDSTAFLENYCYDIPSLIIEHEGYLNSINNKFQDKYKLLSDNNIFFEDSVLPANHINNIWPNVEKWWLHKTTIKAVNKFNNNLNARGGISGLNLLKSKLLDFS